MALYWDVKNLEFNPWYKGVNTAMGGVRVAKPEDENVGEYLNPVTNTLIWATMIVDMGKLVTEKEIEEFALRIRLYEMTCGPLMRQPEDLEGAIAAGSLCKVDNAPCTIYP